MAQMWKRNCYNWAAAGACMVAILMSMGSCSRSSGNASSSAVAMTNEEAHQLAQLMAKPDQQTVALLAIKYDVPSDAVQTLLDLYLSKTDETYESTRDATLGIKKSVNNSRNPLLSLYKDKEVFTRALTYAATSSGIPQKTAAAIVEEYEIETEVQNVSLPQ